MFAPLALLLAAFISAEPASGPAESQTVVPQAQVPAALPSIPAGTEIELVLDETLSSKKHVKGDLFRLKTAEPVKVGDVEVLPQGATVIGEITNAQTKSAFGVSGKLEARLLYAKTANGTVRLTGKLGQRGTGGTTETVLAFAAIGSIAFVVTGKSAIIPAGTRLVAIIEGRSN